MNETVALTLMVIVIIASIITVIFFKNKYQKQAPPVSDNTKEIVALQEEILKKEKEYNEKIAAFQQTVNNHALQERDQALQERDQALQERDQALQERDQALQERDQALQEKDHALQERDQASHRIFELEGNASSQAIDKPHEIKSVLVVDDSTVVRNKMKKLLEQDGYEITTANDGLEALQSLSNKSFSLVITDLEMPNLDGFGLIKKMNENENTKEIPIMAITGHEDMKIQVNQCGSLYSIHKKPWKDKEILKKVKSLSSISN